MDEQYRRFAEESVMQMGGTGEQDEQERRARAKLTAAADAIVQRLTRLGNDTALKRKPIELRWINALCQYSGVRSASEITTGSTKSDVEGGNSGGAKGRSRSEVFVNITRPKTNRTEGRLSDILFPADDRNWGIQPTPQPELDIVAKRAIEEAQRAADEANRINADPEALQSASGLSEDELVDKAQQLGLQGAQAAKELAEAKKRAERMSTEIDDQLVEARYAQKSRDALGWATKIGIGVLKGPVVMDGGRRKWMKQEDGSHVLVHSGEKARPTIEQVSPWSFFPDPSATSIEDAEFIFERHLVSKSDLRKMARKLGFYEDAVRELLEHGPGKGLSEDFQHLKDMRLLTGDSADITDRYVIWEYHGPLEAEEIANLLRAMGGDEAEERAEEFEQNVDTLTEYRVIAHFCDGRLLKLAEYYPMDSQEFIYSVYSLERGTASILGAIGVPDKMKDSQEVLNAAWRMMMDNAKLSVGPQVLIDRAKVQPADNDWTMYPGKEWLWDSHNSQSNVSPFATFDIPMNQEQIAGIIALAKSFIDDETAMPSIIEGGNSEERAPGAASTVGGFAMLMNSAGIDPRRMVKNWDDDVTTPLIRRFYDWNMQHAEKDEIKGDMQVEARGTSVLLARELQAPHLLTAATQLTVHPVLGMAHKPYDIARLFYQSVNINPSDVLVEREEFDQRVKAAAEQTAPEDPQWTVRKEIALIDAEARRYESDASREVAILRLSEESKISIGDIAARLQEANLARQSKERMLAAEIAVEQQNKAEAEAEGREPTGSGGSVSMGSKAA